MQASAASCAGAARDRDSVARGSPGRACGFAAEFAAPAPPHIALGISSATASARMACAMRRCPSRGERGGVRMTNRAAIVLPAKDDATAERFPPVTGRSPRPERVDLSGTSLVAYGPLPGPLPSLLESQARAGALGDRELAVGPGRVEPPASASGITG